MSDKILHLGTLSQSHYQADEREKATSVSISNSLWARARVVVTRMKLQGQRCTMRDYLEGALIEQLIKDEAKVEPVVAVTVPGARQLIKRGEE